MNASSLTLVSHNCTFPSNLRVMQSPPFIFEIYETAEQFRKLGFKSVQYMTRSILSFAALRIND